VEEATADGSELSGFFWKPNSIRLIGGRLATGAFGLAPAFCVKADNKAGSIVRYFVPSRLKSSR
ncbi:MAG: hypothetical protein NTV12_01390, partial [Verrucomicrobia bacterium]|nr:hypothetical protein [Verrucomicrobiota bacterium]